MVSDYEKNDEGRNPGGIISRLKAKISGYGSVVELAWRIYPESYEKYI